MTQEYEFFKDFAGVTKEDLEQLKCGGRMKKKAEEGTKLQKNKPKKDNTKQSSTYVPSRGEGEPDSLYIGKDKGKNFMTRELNTGNMKMMYTKNKKPSTAQEWNKNMKNAKTRKK